MGMLPVAVVAPLLLSAICMLQVPPLASAAAFFRPPKLSQPPKFGNIITPPPRSQLLNKRFKDSLKEHGRDAAVDVAQNLLTPPQSRDTTDSAPAEAAGLYLVDLQVGTPNVQAISGVLDISSSLVWMRCDTACAACQQSRSYLLTQNSGSFNFLSCANRNYCSYCADQTNDRCGFSDSMYTAFDTFTFDATTAVPNMLFGCIEIDSAAGGDYSGAFGVIGLGRGSFSLVSQLQLSNFSYFLAPIDGSGSDSQVQLGGVAVPAQQTGRVVGSTPLYTSSKYTDLYYVRLTGIRVGGEELGIPAGTFDLRNDGSGGVFLSTTTPVTYLLSDAYTVVREAFASRISAAQPLDQGSLAPLCYDAESVKNAAFPSLTLVFEGADAAMELRTENYFLSVVNDDDGSNLVCLTVLPSTGASLLGSLLQTGTTMIYDLSGERLTFVTPEKQKEKDGSSYSPSLPPLISEAPAASLAMAVAVAVAVRLLLL